MKTTIDVVEFTDPYDQQTKMVSTSAIWASPEFQIRIRDRGAEKGASIVVKALQPALEEYAKSILKDPNFLNSLRELAKEQILGEFGRFISERLREE